MVRVASSREVSVQRGQLHSVGRVRNLSADTKRKTSPHTSTALPREVFRGGPSRFVALRGNVTVSEKATTAPQQRAFKAVPIPDIKLDPDEARKKIKIPGIEKQKIEKAKKIAIAVGQQIQRSGQQISGIKMPGFLSLIDLVDLQRLGIKKSEVNDPEIVTLSAYYSLKKVNPKGGYLLGMPDNIFDDEVRAACMFRHYLADVPVKIKGQSSETAYDVENINSWNDFFDRGRLIAFRRSYTVPRLVELSLSGWMDGINPPIRPWRISHGSAWGVRDKQQMMDQITGFTIEVKNKCVDDNNKVNVSAIKAISDWTVRLNDESPKCLQVSGVGRLYLAIKRRYPEMCGWGKDLIKPVDFTSKNMWKGSKGKKLFKDAFVCSLFQAGLGVNNPGTKVTQEDLTLSCTRDEFITWRNDYFNDKNWTKHFVDHGLSAGFKEITHNSIIKAFELWLGKVNSQTKCFGNTKISVEDIYPPRKVKNIETPPLLNEAKYQPEDVTFKCSSYGDSLQGPCRFQGTPLEYIFPDASYTSSVVNRYSEARKALKEAYQVFKSTKGQKNNLTLLEAIILEGKSTRASKQEDKLSSSQLKLLLRAISDEFIPNLNLSEEIKLQIKLQLEDLIRNLRHYQNKTRKKLEETIKLADKPTLNYQGAPTYLGLLNSIIDHVFNIIKSHEQDIENREKDLQEAIYRQKHVTVSRTADTPLCRTTIVWPLLDKEYQVGHRYNEVSFKCHTDSDYLQGPHRLEGTPLEYIFPDSTNSLPVVTRYQGARYALYKLYSAFKACKAIDGPQRALTSIEVVTQASTSKALRINTYPFRDAELKVVLETIRDDILPSLDIDEGLKLQLRELLDKLSEKHCKREIALREAINLTDKPNLTYLGEVTLLGTFNSIFDYIFCLMEKNEEAIKERMQVVAGIGERQRQRAFAEVSYKPEDIKFKCYASTPLESIFLDSHPGAQAIAFCTAKRATLFKAYNAYKAIRTNTDGQNLTPLELVVSGKNEDAQNASQYKLSGRELRYLLYTLRDDIIHGINIDETSRTRLEGLFTRLLHRGANSRRVLEEAIKLTNKQNLHYFRRPTVIGLLNSILCQVLSVMEQNEEILLGGSQQITVRRPKVTQDRKVPLGDSQQTTARHPTVDQDTRVQLQQAETATLVSALLIEVENPFYQHEATVDQDLIQAIDTTSNSSFYKVLNAVVASSEAANVEPNSLTLEKIIQATVPGNGRAYILSEDDLRELLSSLPKATDALKISLKTKLMEQLVSSANSLRSKSVSPRNILASAVDSYKTTMTSPRSGETISVVGGLEQIVSNLFLAIAQKAINERIAFPRTTQASSFDPHKVQAAKLIAKQIYEDKKTAELYLEVNRERPCTTLEQEVSLIRRTKTDVRELSRAEALERVAADKKAANKREDTRLIELGSTCATNEQFIETVKYTASKLNIPNVANDAEMQALIALYCTKQAGRKSDEPEGFLTSLPERFLEAGSDAFMPRVRTLWKLLA